MFLIGVTWQHMHILGLPCVETPTTQLRMACGCSLLAAVLRLPSLLYLSHGVLFHVELSSWVLPLLNLLRFGGTKAQDHHRSKPRPLSTDSLSMSILTEVLICGCQTEVSRGRRQHRQKNAKETCRIENVFPSKQPFKELEQRGLLYCVDGIFWFLGKWIHLKVQ